MLLYDVTATFLAFYAEKGQSMSQLKITTVGIYTLLNKTASMFRVVNLLLKSTLQSTLS